MLRFWKLCTEQDHTQAGEKASCAHRMIPEAVKSNDFTSEDRNTRWNQTRTDESASRALRITDGSSCTQRSTRVVQHTQSDHRSCGGDQSGRRADMQYTQNDDRMKQAEDLSTHRRGGDNSERDL